MGVINFYEDIFAGEPVRMESWNGATVGSAVRRYLDSRSPCSELVETYNIETGETAYVPADDSSFKVIALSGSEEVGLSYRIRKDDVISVIVIPEKLNNAMSALMSTVGSLASMVGSLLVLSGVGTGVGAALMGVGAALTLWAGVSSYLNNKGAAGSSTQDTGLTSEQTLSISGCSNQDIVGQRFPFVMGKHLVNPVVVGSPYNVTVTKNRRGEDGGVYLKCLYAVGYAPLKISNIKIGSVLAAYNTTPSSGVIGEHSTVMHGILQGYNDDDTGDILKKWKNNDLKIEILQKGDFAESDDDRYGGLYPQVCRQTEVNANLLNIKDKEIEDIAAKVYKGVAVPNGFKNNSVYFSGSCPKKLEVELDFPNGLYATRSISDNKGNLYNLYYNLPVRIAVQWRFVRSGQISSDADEPYNGGWKDFTSVELADGTGIRPQTYTFGQLVYDYNSSLGKDGYFTPGEPGTYKAVIGNKWITRGKTFNFGCENVPAAMDSVRGGGSEKTHFYLHTVSMYYEEPLYDEYGDPIGDLYNEYGELVRPGSVWKTAFIDKTLEVSEADFRKAVPEYTKGTEKYSLVSKRQDALGSHTDYRKAWIGEIYYSFDYGYTADSAGDFTLDSGLLDKSICDSPHYSTDFKQNFGVNERRYVVSYELTDEECRELINYGGGDVTTDCVEVRVLRVNPTYFDQTADLTGSVSAMSYQDLCRWKFLRTKSFDKDAFRERLDEVKAAGGDISSVHAADYPLRPLSKGDMDKLVLMAVSLKQDAAETGGSSLSQVSCIAESFCPNYADNGNGGKEWFPAEINAVEGYYRKSKRDAGGGRLVTEITEAATDSEIEEYKKKIEECAEGYYKAPKGNDFTRQLKAEIFAAENRRETQYILPANTAYKYITNNTASVFALALVGPLLGVDAKTYDSINMEALTDFYEFCSDLTDGTPADSDTVPDMDRPETLRHFFLACNGVVSSEVKMETLLQKILATGRASLKRDDWNRYEVSIGRRQDYPVMLLNQQTVLSASNSRSFDSAPSGLQVQFVDESDNYSQNDIYIMADGESYKSPTGEIEAYSFQYVTNREQIWTLGRFSLGCRTMQRETYTRTVGKCGYLLSYGDMVLMADPTLVVGTGNGGRIQKVLRGNGKIYGFITDEPFEYKVERDGTTKMGVTILQTKRHGRSQTVTLRLADSKMGPGGKMVGPGVLFTGQEAPVAAIDYYTDSGLETHRYAPDAAEDGATRYQMNPGLTNTVILRTPVSIDDESSDETSISVYVKPSEDDAVAFGEYGEITQKAVVTAVKPKDKEMFELTLVPYDESLYEQGAVMAEFRSHMTNIERDSTLSDFSEVLGKDDVNSAAVGITENVSKAVADLQDTIGGLYSNHIVTLYRDSDRQLGKDDLPDAAATYSFRSNTLVFASDGEEKPSCNGWAPEYPQSIEHTVYVTTATAFGQLPEDEIEPSEWAAPIPVGLNGSNGYNTRTISLYMRSGSVPQKSGFPDRLRYDFATGELSGYTGEWSMDIPDMTNSATSLFEIHATALSTSGYDFIEKDEWSAPVKISDGITEETVKKVLDENPNLLAGNVYLYVSSPVLAFAVDDGGLALCDQSAETTFAVKQQGEDLDFTFGSLPEINGVTYVLDGQTLKVKVRKGTFLAFQSIDVPVNYREYLELNYYTDENGDYYTDENGDPYFIYNFKDKPTTYVFRCSLLPQKGGRQRTDCRTDAEADALAELVLGDYFCFTGESTERFRKGEVYIWTGEEWTVDTYSSHVMASLSSILSTNSDTMAGKSRELAAHLAENGEYLERLLSADNTKFIDEICANDAYIRKLVAQDAFIDSLTANSVFAERLVAGEAFIKEFSADTGVVQSLYGNQAFLSKISAGLVKVTGEGTIYDSLTRADEQMLQSSKDYADGQADEKKREAITEGLKALGLDATVAGNETEILPGYIRTDLINAKALVIGDASIEKLDDDGSVVYKKDEDGNIVLDGDGNPVPETVSLSESIGSMARKIYRAGAYQPLYWRTNNRDMPSPPSDGGEITDGDVLGKWTTRESTRKVSYTYVCYRYRSPDDGSYRYTGVSCDAATIISNGRIITSLIDTESLFASSITMKSGGVIRSSNWNGTCGSDGSITGYGDAGWAIDFSGRSDFTGINATGGTFTDIKAVGMTAEGGTFENVSVSGAVNATSGIMSNITINGSSTFNGDIISGPLELTSNVPLGEQTVYPAGTDITFPVEGETITGVEGRYGNVNFYTAVFSGYIEFVYHNPDEYGSYYDYRYRARLSLYDQQGNLLFFDRRRVYVTSNEVTGAYSLDFSFSYRYIFSKDVKTLRLKNLPTRKPAEKNIVWNDNGLLRIS